MRLMEKRKRGTGWITKKGYVMTWKGFEHRLVWEANYGPVPDGFCIHHINEDRQDNRIENLALVDALIHRRIHGGCKLIDGEWWKPCHRCGVLKPLEAGFYKQKKGGVAPREICRTCSAELDKKRDRHGRHRRQTV